jgi:hypothetical protein
MVLYCYSTIDGLVQQAKSIIEEETEVKGLKLKKTMRGFEVR